MSVAQRGKQGQWPSAAVPTVAGSRARDVRSSPLAAAAQREAALRWLENRDGGRSIAWVRRVVRVIWQRCSLLNAPVMYPWFASRRGHGAPHELHRLAAGLTRKYHGRGWERLWLWAKAGCWPVLATAAIGPLLWRCGRRVARSHGISVWTQARDISAAAWRHGIFPTEYYHRRVFRISTEVDRANYLHERELRALLKECAQGTDAARVDDLSRFMAECRMAGLPTPRTIAIALRGQSEFVTDAPGETLPPRDIFLRPSVWTGSVTGQHWRWNPRTKMWTFHDQSLAAPGLLEHAGRLAERQPWVLHEGICNHPDISRFASGGVCTARIATSLDEAGQPRVLFAALHLPASSESGWGPAPGELVAGIDIASGRLGVAMDEFVSDGEFSVHPATGSMIEDAIVPQWSALRDLALRAHQRFADLRFVGWRIALSGGGPVLLEASTDWGVFRHVWPAQTAFASGCLQRLNPQSSAGAPRTGRANSARDVAVASRPAAP